MDYGMAEVVKDPCLRPLLMELNRVSGNSKRLVGLFRGTILIGLHVFYGSDVMRSCPSIRYSIRFVVRTVVEPSCLGSA